MTDANSVIKQSIFVLGDNGYPEIILNTNERNDMLYMIQQKTVFAHQDRSIVPILLIGTEGNQGDETQSKTFKNIWLSLLDIKKIKVLKSAKLLFRCPPELVSRESIAQSFHLAMSSKTSFFHEDRGDIVHRQNYHILNLSSEMCFNEILEYHVDYITDKKGEHLAPRLEMVGIAALVTTENFDYRDASLYPLFDDKNKVIGSQIVFGNH